MWWSRPSLRPLSRSVSSLISASNDVEVHVFAHKPLVNKASLSGRSRNWGFCPAGGNLSAAMTHSQHSRLDFHRQATQLTLTFMSFAPSRPSYLPRGSMKGWFRCWRWVWTTPMSLFGKQNNFYPFVPSTPNPLITHTNKPQVAVMNPEWHNKAANYRLLFDHKRQRSPNHSATTLTEERYGDWLPQCFSLKLRLPAEADKIMFIFSSRCVLSQSQTQMITYLMYWPTVQ